ncbi:MAG: DUF4115 domain-containing protein [Chitinispirillaceae bacterium]|nr:DUF4115 domain-containing protein [Chitinispirillaceae bacterium]
MSRNTPNTPQSETPDPHAAGNERIGEILRKAREIRGIDVETLAKELKLNARYVQALEANDYDELPGDTYIRVYLRSLCVYFSLNPEELLMRFFDERGVTGVDTLRKDSSTKINISAVKERKNSRIAIPLVLLAIVLLAVALIIAGSKQGWFGAPLPEKKLAQSEQGKPAASAAHDSLLPPSEQKDAPAGSRAAMKKETDNRPALLTGLRLKKQIIKDTVKQKPAGIMAKSVESGVAAPDAKNERKKSTHDSLKKSKPTVTQVKDSGAVAATGRKKQPDSLKQPSPQALPSQDSARKKTAALKKSRDSSAASKTPDSSVQGPTSTHLKKEEKKKDAETAGTDLARQKKDLAKTTPAPADTAEKTASPATSLSAKKMKLRLSVTSDSCWARVFYDGKQWRNLLREGKSISFSAGDSFNVHIGVNEAVSITLDGKPVAVPGSGVVSFKIDSSGTVSTWNSAKWNEVFQNRD